MPYEVRVISAHRAPEIVRAYAATRPDGMGLRFDALFGSSSAGDTTTATARTIAQGGAFVGYRAERWSFQTGLRIRDARLPLVMDFSDLEYMNSSTFTPVVKALDESRRLAVPVVLEYSLTRKWQALSFSALRTFETLDGRIKIIGK